MPALLYFVAVWVGIDAFSTRYKLAAMPTEMRPSAQQVFITSAFFMVPFGVLLWGMFGAGYTPQYAACLAIVAGALNIYVAYVYSEPTWVKFKLFGLIGLTVVFIIGQSLWLAKQINDSAEE